MVKAVVGANWGDEGKGKITDMLAKQADIIVRFQGGANAGHTIVNDYGKFALHTLPSGVFYSHTTSVIGNGVALDIPRLFKEIKSITDRNVPMPKILVSNRAQIVMPYHVLFDQYEEERLGGKSFGSTKSGIAPFYSDKYAKIGFQVSELFDDELLKEKAYTGFMNDILPHDPRYITQSFAMDFEEGCIYTSQVVTETNPEHILISKIRMSDKKVLGYMRLHGFGHGSQIGIDKLDGVTKIWCECYGEPHITTGKLFGTKICRFTFENGKEYTTSAGNVFDMVTDARNIQVSVSEQTNRLSVKYITYSNKNAIKVYDLKSVIDNDPRMLASFTIPSWLETSISPNQGHSVYGNRVYHYQGGDSAVNESKARVTIFDLMGNVLDSNIILDDINLDVKEPEGLFVRENNGIYELYAGLSEGAWPNRKYHIYKFMDSLDDDFEKRGSFIHNNGYKSNESARYKSSSPTSAPPPPPACCQ